MLIVVTFVAVSLIGLLATRRPARRLAAGGNDLTNNFVSAVGGYYALRVGLIAVATWERFSSIEGVISLEAAANRQPLPRVLRGTGLTPGGETLAAGPVPRH